MTPRLQLALDLFVEQIQQAEKIAMSEIHALAAIACAKIKES